MNWLKKIAHLSRKYELHIKNILYFLVTRLTAIVAFIIVVPFFIHHASAEQYGLASIGFSLLIIATALDIAFGYALVQSLGRRYARGKDIAGSPTIHVFSLYLNIAIFIGLIGVIIISNIGLTNPEILMYSSLAALLPALCVSGCVAAIFQSQNNLKPINLSRFIFEISKVSALTISAFFAKDISLIGPVLLIFAYGRSFVDLHYLYKLTGIRFSYKPRLALAKGHYWRIMAYGRHPFVMVSLMIPVTIGDKLIIKNLFGPDSVANYSIAFDISSKAYLLVNAVSAAMFSVVLHQHARKSSIFKPVLVGLIAVTVLLFGYYIPLAVFAKPILDYWLNNELSEQVVPLLRVMVVASILYLYANVFESALTAIGKAKELFHVYLLGAIAYWIGMYISYKNKILIGFVFSYLALCLSLLIGFLLIYFRHIKKQREIVQYG